MFSVARTDYPTEPGGGVLARVLTPDLISLTFSVGSPLHLGCYAVCGFIGARGQFFMCVLRRRSGEVMFWTYIVLGGPFRSKRDGTSLVLLADLWKGQGRGLRQLDPDSGWGGSPAVGTKTVEWGTVCGPRKMMLTTGPSTLVCYGCGVSRLGRGNGGGGDMAPRMVREGRKGTPRLGKYWGPLTLDVLALFTLHT